MFLKAPLAETCGVYIQLTLHVCLVKTAVILAYQFLLKFSLPETNVSNIKTFLEKILIIVEILNFKILYVKHMQENG